MIENYDKAHILLIVNPGMATEASPCQIMVSNTAIPTLFFLSTPFWYVFYKTKQKFSSYWKAMNKIVDIKISACDAFLE
jgi:hypothetical protein